MDMIITYKIIHGLVCVPCGEFFVFNLGMTRSNGLKLSKEHVNTNVRLHCYSSSKRLEFSTILHSLCFGCPHLQDPP